MTDKPKMRGMRLLPRPDKGDTLLQFMGGTVEIPTEVAELLAQFRDDPEVYRARVIGDGGGVLEWMGGRVPIPRELAEEIIGWNT